MSTSGKPSRQQPVVKDERLDNVYSIMQSAENRLGGGEGVQGIYGSITRTGMQKIFDSMRHNCGLDKHSVLVDVGAGLGRPLLHALVNPGVQSAYGIELDDVKVAKAGAFIEQTLAELAKRGHVAADMIRPAVQCTSIEQVGSFGPATHAYSFWEGIPVEGREAFARLFAASKLMKCVAVVQRAIRNQHPAQLMQSYGFGPLMLIANFPVSMSGSGASFQAYVFSKIPAASAAFLDNVRAGPLPARAASKAAQSAEQLPATEAQVQQGPPDVATGETSQDNALQRAPGARKGGKMAKGQLQQQQQLTLAGYGRQTKQRQGPAKPAGSAAAKLAEQLSADVGDYTVQPAVAAKRSSRRIAAKSGQ